MRVLLTKLAAADVLAAVQWWQDNVGNAPAHLLAGLHHAQERLAATPHVGVPVPRAEGRGLPTLRRLSLPGSRYSLFYEVDAVRGEVLVLRVWHMSRGRSLPPLR